MMMIKHSLDDLQLKDDLLRGIHDAGMENFTRIQQVYFFCIRLIQVFLDCYGLLYNFLVND
jgi:hypothetical protein